MGKAKNFFKKTWSILKDARTNFQEGEPIVYSAAIAFFMIFSLPAILIVLTLVGSTFFAEEEVRTEIVSKLEELVNPEVGEQVAAVLENVIKIPAGFWGILIAIVVVAKSATIIFFIIQKALNSVWNIKVKKDINYLKLLSHRLLTLAMVFGLGVLLAASLLMDAVLSIYSDELYSVLEEHFSSGVRLIQKAFSLLVVLIFFTSVHKFLPDVRVSWKDAIAGGIITSILFLIGKEVINYVLASIKVVGIYAAAGSFVIILLWVFYSSIILMLGAEVTKAYANNHGRKAEPSSIAEKYEKVAKG